MKRRMLRVAGLAVLFGGLSVATAHADTRFSIHVGIGAPMVAPAPVVVAPAPYGGYVAPSPYGGYVAPDPYAGYVWQPGFYSWTGFTYQWIPGAWVARGRVAPRWDRRNWHRDRRHWERDRFDRRGWRR